MGLLYFLIGILCTARQLPYLMSSNNTKCMYLPGTLPGTVKLIAISLLILDQTIKVQKKYFINKIINRPTIILLISLPSFLHQSSSIWPMRRLPYIYVHPRIQKKIEEKTRNSATGYNKGEEASYLLLFTKFERESFVLQFSQPGNFFLNVAVENKIL